MHYEDSLDPGIEGELDAARKGDRLPQVPEKFRDPATGQVRTEALLKAYRDLEKRMSGMVKVPCPDCSAEELAAFRRGIGVPDSADGYRVDTRHPMLTSDTAVNDRLHQAGFTPAQVQLVYDIAHERVPPLLAHGVAEAQRQHSLERLMEHFGGEARWTETARQLAAWGKASLPPEMYRVLSSSPEGVKALQRLMAAGEPALGRTQAATDEAPSEDQLKKMMQDPRYWKTRDPAYIDKVSAGFRRLYGEE